MKTYTLHLHSLTQARTLPEVQSLVARDASGSFGIQAGHEDFMTALEFGLARYRAREGSGEGGWQYLALPGGILRVHAGEVWLFTRRFLEDSDYRRLSGVIERELRAEEEALRQTRTSIQQMEQQLLRRLWELEQHRWPV